MSSANANSSKRKSLILGKLNPIAAKIDKDIIVIPNKTDSFVFDIEDGCKEITAYNNGVKEKDGKVTRINNKTGKAYKTRTIPMSVEKKEFEHEER